MNYCNIWFGIFLTVFLSNCSECKKRIEEKERVQLNRIIDKINEGQNFKGYKIGPVERRKRKVLFKRPNGEVFYVRGFNISNPEKLRCVDNGECEEVKEEIYKKLKSLTEMGLIAVTTESNITYYYTNIKNDCYRYVVVRTNTQLEIDTISKFYDNKGGYVIKIKDNWFLLFSSSFLEYKELP